MTGFLQVVTTGALRRRLGGFPRQRAECVPVDGALGRVEILAHGVAMGPGKPALFARWGGKAIFGLPIAGRALLDQIRSARFREQVLALGGYVVEETGKLVL